MQGAPPGGPERTAVRAGSWPAGAQHARDGRRNLPCHAEPTCHAPSLRVRLGGFAGRGTRSASARTQRSHRDLPECDGGQGALPDVCARAAPAGHAVAEGGPGLGSSPSEHGGNGYAGMADGSQPGPRAEHHDPEHEGAGEEPEALQVPSPLLRGKDRLLMCVWCTDCNASVACFYNKPRHCLSWKDDGAGRRVARLHMLKVL